MKFVNSKALNRVIDELVKEGWMAEKNAKHCRLTPAFPGVPKITISVSPSCSRAEMNALGDIKRAFRTAGREVPEYVRL